MHTTINLIAQIGYRTYPGAAREPGSVWLLVVAVGVLYGAYRYFLRQAKRQQARGGHPSTGRDA
jgi:hypothetical protein